MAIVLDEEMGRIHDPDSECTAFQCKQPNGYFLIELFVAVGTGCC